MLKKDRRTKIKPIDGKWSPEVFRKYDNDWLLRQTWDYEEEDYQMAYYALFEELAMRALEDQSILDDVIAAKALIQAQRATTSALDCPTIADIRGVAVFR